MSCSATNTIFVIVIRQKGWKVIQSQPTAIVPVPLQGFAHPKKRYLEDGQARYSKVWVLVTKKKKKYIYIHRWPEAFCVIWQRAETLRAGVLHGRWHEITAAPLLLLAAHGYRPPAAVCLRPAAPTYISLISIRCSPLFCSKTRFHQHLPTVSMQSLCFLSIMMWNDKFRKEFCHTSAQRG